MTELEKVMKGLEHCKTEDCSGCPYEDTSAEIGKFGTDELVACKPVLYDDALSLLKTLELLKTDARVLTLEELRKTPSGSVLWNEWAQDEEIELYPLEFQKIYMHTFPDGLTEEVVEFSNGMDYADEYGKQYRLWTAKPTDEQRKAVKWE